MSFKSLDLTTALRPSLLPDEILLFVQNEVGLYGGKYKIPNYQRGHAYLTSHRICYVDDDQPRTFSTAVDLRDVDRAEYQARFLKSSPKITIYPKPSKRGRNQDRGISTTSITGVHRTSSPGNPSSPLSRSGSPFLPPGPASTRPTNATWICPICTFSNPVPTNFDPATATASSPIPPCLACGIKPPFTTVLKAAISSVANRGPINSAASPLAAEPDQTGVRRTIGSNGIGGDGHLPRPSQQSSAPRSANVSCPRCTFANHPSLLECEICGARLKRPEHVPNNNASERSDSPGPLLGNGGLESPDARECIKLSFRGGGEKIFHERLKGALIQRKWLLHDAPPVPKASPSPVSPGFSSLRDDRPASTPPPLRSTGVGIAGLERRGIETRKNNEVVLGSAFEDLEALMASAKEIVALAETFAKESSMASNAEGSTETNSILSQSAAALGMVTTKDMLGVGSENLYLSELARNLAEYLTDDRKGVLHREGGIMSLMDLWAVFNRSRNGVELVSPADFRKAAELWEKLKLPVRLRRFKSGLLVVQRFDWNDDKTIGQLQSWFDEMRCIPPAEAVAWDWQLYGRGITAQEAAGRFGWSVGVASEELEMAEDRGVLCREEGIEGLRFWSNHLLGDDDTGAEGHSNIYSGVSTLTI
ncbi:hypothetical protein AJ80_05696 [Polytolypa hystricis UAMH7299]|uniref:Vacuolar protein-sorting-associated protein 36 n=1 Tax=Polytolypa hystricis (strain UAMH7299) TaxID=1447883 RepID=A0A2B7Y200_POLH7|nr:hypothetical protein AJ80_05696 [Polytolypa hystricis UAMH7299]